MSRVLLSDALHLAAALVRLPPARRANELQGWIVQAHAAAKYMRRFGRPHPGWGDGILPLGRCTLVPGKTTVKGAKVRISFVRSHLLPIVLVVLPRPGADPAPDPDLGRRFAQILTLAF
jgi:hypothetical protein